MRQAHIRSWSLLITVLGLMALVLPTLADTRPKASPAELDQLFAELQTARTAEQASRIEHEIWSAWTRSGDAEVDELLELAITAMQTGQHDDALAVLDAVVAKQPGFAEGWNKRATVLYLLGELDRSMADIEHVLALEPRHFGALSGLGLIQAAKGDKRLAIEAYRKVIEIYPQNTNARRSIETLEQEIEGDPT